VARWRLKKSASSLSFTLSGETGLIHLRKKQKLWLLESQIIVVTVLILKSFHLYLCRWSKIARKLPGRTDNEIKNYWRTHMRKKAQEKKRPVSPTSSFSNCSSSSVTTTTTNTQDTSCHSRKSSGEVSFYDTGGSRSTREMNQENEDVYSLDDIWREIDHSAVNIIKPVKDIYSEQSHCLSYPNLASPSWESSLDSIWNMDADKSKISSYFANDQFPFCFQHSRSPWSSG